MNYRKIVFKPHGDPRGKLVAIEHIKDVPFDIKRVYYIYDTLNDVVRGKHAHKKLEQVLICVSGSCKILLKDGKTKKVITLNKPNVGLFISNNIWREMYDFKEGTVLMVLASKEYDEKDYIRNYDEYLKYIGKQ